MKEKMKMNYFFKVVICGLLIALFSTGVFAESVFLKNGSIEEGVIISEDDRGITLENSAGERSAIARGDILRILVHKRYMDRIYLTRNDGFTFEGFIVNEDNSFITMRSVLFSPEEMNFPREEIETISRKRPQDRVMPAVRYSSVFLETGEIIDCRIVREASAFIEIVPVGEDRRIIRRNEILRIQYNNSYKDKRILTKRDGSRIEAYIMDEDDRAYTFRRELNSSDEERVLKNDLTSISSR